MIKFRGYINDNYVEYEGDSDKFLEIIDALSYEEVEDIYTYYSNEEDDSYDLDDFFRY